MSDVRFATQRVIKSLVRSVGLEIRYAFQNPPLTSAAIYAPWLAPKEVTCIFDVGANVGQSARAFAKEFDRSIVHSFEPFPAAYARLEKLAKSSGGRIKAHRLACGSSIGEMDVAVDPEATSALNQLRPASSGKQKNRVQISTIDAICGHHGIERIDILKTDTEGYDAEVLAGAHRMLSGRRVRCIIVRSASSAISNIPISPKFSFSCINQVRNRWNLRNYLFQQLPNRFHQCTVRLQGMND